MRLCFTARLQWIDYQKKWFMRCNMSEVDDHFCFKWFRHICSSLFFEAINFSVSRNSFCKIAIFLWSCLNSESKGSSATHFLMYSDKFFGRKIFVGSFNFVILSGFLHEIAPLNLWCKHDFFSALQLKLSATWCTEFRLLVLVDCWFLFDGVCKKNSSNGFFFFFFQISHFCSLPHNDFQL